MIRNLYKSKINSQVKEIIKYTNIKLLDKQLINAETKEGDVIDLDIDLVWFWCAIGPHSGPHIWCGVSSDLQ